MAFLKFDVDGSGEISNAGCSSSSMWTAAAHPSPRHRALLAADLADAEDGDRHLALHVRLEPRRQEVGIAAAQLGRRRAGVDLRERRHVLPQRCEARRTAVRRVEGAEVVHPRA